MNVGMTGRGGSHASRLRPGALLAAVLVAGVLGACATVPTSGPIEQGPVVDSGESTQFIRVIAAPPSSGAAPEEIVRGFLEANASLEQDHGIARRYLTEDAAEAWEPSASTTIYDPASLRLSERGNRVRAEFTVVGELLADGLLVNVDPARDEVITFPLQRILEPGATTLEWRIADPPPGVLISSTDLRRAYRPYDAHFLADRSDVLVPDGRLVPVVGASLPTRLAELVLAGPAAWLAPAVSADALTGAELALDAVPLDGGIAEVQLTEEALAATDQQRRALAAQLTWTLTQLPEVSGVRLEVGGEPYPVPGAPEVMGRSDWESLAPDVLSLGPGAQRRPAAYVLDGETIVRTGEASTTVIPVAVEDAGKLGGLAVGLDERRAAAIAPGGSGVWLLPLNGTSSATLVAAEEVTDITFDVDGLAWFAAAGQVLRIGADGEPATVPLRGADLGPVTSVQLARDGTRVALVIDGRVHLGVLVERGGELGIESVRRADAAIREAIGVAWRDAGALDVLGALAGGGRQVLRLSVGSGQVVPLGAPDDPREVAAAPQAVTLVATGGELIAGNVGLQWRERGPGRSVAYPG